jgi:hypothetical protein
MLKITLSEALCSVARRLVWFKSPEDALADPYLFLGHVMTFGTIEDVRIVKASLGIDAFREALEHMPPGIMDPKSWTYWHIMTNKQPEPPMPVRQFND